MPIGPRTISHKRLDFTGRPSKQWLMATAADTPFLASSRLEKVLEHRFVAELTTELWLDGISDFEVLRGEVDSHGYDIVVEAGGTIRHIQLKAMVRGGRRREVGVSTRLSAKPSGCVIWMVYDPDTLALGPFHWFGGSPGEPLPDLGDRAARHTRGNALGVKAARQGHRLLGRSRFELLADMADVAGRLFGCEGPEVVTSHEEQLALIRQHLALTSPSDRRPWLAEVQRGRFDAIPSDLRWDGSVELAHLIDGYRMVRQAGWGNPFRYADRRLARAMKSGDWSGGPAELWASLFLEHRRWRMSRTDPYLEMRSLLDQLCAALRAKLRSE